MAEKVTAPIDRIVRSRAAYERLLKRVAVLEAKVRTQDAELRAMGARVSARLRGAVIKSIDDVEHAARQDRCDECGAGVGEPCRFPNDQARRRSHHLRGRREACGKDGCWECRRAFVFGHQDRAI